MSGELSGRTALITGGSQGLGLEIARQYLRAGIAGLCICGRDRDTLAAAHGELQALAQADQEVLAEAADVSDAVAVERLAASVLERFPELTILVNNAGIYGPKGTIDQLDWRDWARAIEINLLGSMLPARALMPHFKRRGYGKIVQLSGGGATNPLPGLSAYAASKAGAVRFAETLAEELREHRVDVNSVAPGALNTRMLDEVIEAGPERVGEAFYARALEQQRSGGAPLERGAALAVWLGSQASDGVTAKLLSALWDPWADLGEHLGDLASDVYTLRRIVPNDRGLTWGDDV
ncbi:MAG TPA: SDR family oxidoreductase [Solirubrobacteraceae bacterium]|nr:SDR family oxidoreductase [Solirubrobacteraceae bacterium]